MDNNYMIAIVTWLGFTFASRIINDRASKKLEQDKKAALIDLFSKSGRVTFGIMIVIIVLFFLSLKFKLIVEAWTAFFAYFTSVSILLFFSSYGSYKKLKENNFPDSYISAYILSTALRLLGFVLFFAIAGSNYNFTSTE
jgi:hypothetical protein